LCNVGIRAQRRTAAKSALKWPRRAALNALTVEIAPRDQLVNANTLYGLANSATRIAGPALGGVLVALAGAAVLVAADAASYAVSVLAPQPAPPAQGPGRNGRHGRPGRGARRS
jgi:hypothetical protein